MPDLSTPSSKLTGAASRRLSQRPLPLLRVFAIASALLIGHSHLGAETVPAGASPEALVGQAYGQIDSGKPDLAVSLFHEALRIDEGYLPAKLGLAVTFSELSRHAEAFTAFDQILQLEPDNVFAWNGRGIASFNLEQFDEAAVALERAIRDQPVNGFFYESLAWTYMCMGDFKQALDTAKIATLMYNKKNESTAYPLLIAYFSGLESGDTAAAERALAYALRHKPPLNPWPHPVFDFLAGKSSIPELISLVRNSAEETEAHTYIGLKLRAGGDALAAARHMDWVARKGDKRVFEYTLARTLSRDSGVAALSN